MTVDKEGWIGKNNFIHKESVENGAFSNWLERKAHNSSINQSISSIL